MKHKNICNVCNKNKSAKFERIGLFFSKGLVRLSFRSIFFTIYMGLSNPLEWNAMIVFLKKTKKQGSIPKGKKGYTGYNIRTGEASFCGSSEHERLYEIDYQRKENHSHWKKLKKNIENDVKLRKKTGIDEYMHLDYDNFTIQLTRENFIKFREGCLSFKSQLRWKKYGSASIVFG